MPTRDPYEALRVSPQDDPRAPKGTWKGVMNQLFGDAKTIDRLPTPEDGAPAMLGFRQDYYTGTKATAARTSRGPSRPRKPA